jgi:nucleoid-associated protein YgaU
MVTAQGKPPCTYTVQSGDTLFDIAQAYYGDGNQYQKIVGANKDQNVTPATLVAGSTIQIPAESVQGQGAVAPTTAIVGTTQIPAQSNQGQGAVAPTTVMSGTTHTVRAGESIYGIAEAYYGDCRQWRMISAANGNVQPESLTAGQQLRIPVHHGEGPSLGPVAYPRTGHW